MVCPAYSGAVANYSANRERRRWKPAVRSRCQAVAPLLAKRGGPSAGRDRDDECSETFVSIPEEWCQSDPLREPQNGLAPLSMTGSLAGNVIDPYGLLPQARLLF